MSSEADAAAGGGSQEAGGVATTKRAHSEKLKKHGKNRWPQHPNIRDPEKRAKAYVRTAGLVKPKKLDDLSTERDPTTMKLGRLLGGTDQRTRHAAVLKLQSYLKARCAIENGGFSELDLLKLWKGLWFTLYMADKAPVQEELSMQIAKLIWCFQGTEEEDEYAGAAYIQLFGDENDETVGTDDSMGDGSDDGSDVSHEVTMEEIVNNLGDGGEADDSDSSKEVEKEIKDKQENEIVDEGEEEEEVEDTEDDSEIRHCRGAHLASLFVRTFFATLRREWGKMDKYRIDKFYTLTRFLIREVFEYMAKRHWSVGVIRLFNDAIFEEVLSKTPNGLRYHLIDITLKELAAANAASPMPLTEATFLDTLEPYFGLLQTTEASVHQRVVENIMERFLADYSVLSERFLSSDDDAAEDERHFFDEVHVGTVAKFLFDVASDGTTLDVYRKDLYNLHKKFQRRLKEVGKDVSLEVVQEGEGDEPEQDLKLKDQEDEQQDEEISGSPEHCSMMVDEDESASSELKVEGSSVSNKTEANSKKETELAKQNETLETKQGSSHGDKGKKKKKKKKKKTGEKTEAYEGETEITISIEDQKRAIASVQKPISPEIQDTKKRKEQSDDREELQQQNKRVKFNKSDAARSWKASMKGLRTMEKPSNRASPEKSILLNKDTPVKKNRKEMGRKKARDYF